MRLEDVARAAGVSKATLYAYFAGKDALFAAIVGWVLHVGRDVLVPLAFGVL